MKINKVKFLGAMIFITLLMDVVPFVGFMKIGSISITNLHIPAILTAIVLGPGYGLAVGTVFGIISLMRAVSRESAILDILLQNPLISLLPRMCFPLLAGYAYQFMMKLFKQKGQLAAVALASLIGSVLNSFLVLSSLYMIYPDQFLACLDFSPEKSVFYSILSAFGPNVLVESSLCIIACTLFVYALPRLKQKIDKIS